MKLYNIENTKGLFETLSECEGNVELVNENGEHLELSTGKGSNLNVLSETYVNGTIKELELCFESRRDVFRMLDFLSGVHNAA